MTRRGLETLQQGQTLWDGKVKGFGARRQSENGAISLFLMARLKGRKRRISIGRLGQPWTVETARNEAKKMLGKIASGVDPSINALEERQTLNELAEKWLSHYVEHELKERTRRSYTANVRLYMEKKIGRLPLASVDHAAVQLWHDSMRETPRAANYALATLSSMWSWALQRGLISLNNPCQNVKRFPENKRTRFVTRDEVARLFSALGVEAGKTPYGVAAIKLMLFTGARQSEILTARWEEISGDYLRLEDSKTGSRKIYLTPQASEVLANIPRLTSNPFVICGAKDGAHLVNIKDLWKRVITAAGIEDCRIHDLRHSYASFAVSSGSTLAEIGGQLGHRSAQTTSRYAHLFDDPVRRSAEIAARFIEQAAGVNEIADQRIMAEKKRDKPATGGFRKNYDGLTAWVEYYELDNDICHQIIEAGELSPTEDFISALREEVLQYVCLREMERTAPHGGGSGRTNDFWGDHICRIIELYESFGGTYGLGRKNPSRENLEGSVGSPFFSFAIEINKALPPEYRRLTVNKWEFALAIRRARPNRRSANTIARTLGKVRRAVPERITPAK